MHGKIKHEFELEHWVLTDPGKDASSELVSLGQNNPEVILDFSQAVIVETPELTDYAEEWREAPPEWWKLINEASNAYSRKKYIVVRDLLNEAKSIAPLDYRAKPLLFRALRKLTDPKLVRRLSVEVLSELSVGVE